MYLVHVFYMFSIACKINLGLIKNNGNPGGRGIFGLGNPGGRWGELIQEIQVGRGGGGNLALHRGCVEFFWNSPLGMGMT